MKRIFSSAYTILDLVKWQKPSFNKLAIGKVQAYSAGTQPGDKINPVVIEAMKEVGIGISGEKPNRKI